MRRAWLALTLACAGACAGRSTRPANSPAHPPAGSPSVAALAPAVSDDGWRVSIFPKFDERAPSSIERWPALDHAWTDACGPGKVVAERRLCLPRGSYVVESLSSEHVDVKVDGQSVIAPRIELARTIGGEPLELSRPIAIDGCVHVEALMPGQGCFPQSRIRVTVREARKAGPCDVTSFPSGSWNACIYAGRRQEELVATATWNELVSPWPRGLGPTGDDSFSVEARTTACFAKSRYVFHARVPADRLKLYLDDVLVVDPKPTTPRNVVDSEPRALDGCHKLRATYTALDRDTAFEIRWASVGSPTERRWAAEAQSCDPPCEDGARCVAGGTFGIEGKNARICLPVGRPGRLGEACSEKQPCAAGQELTCCRSGDGCGKVSGVCTYHDR